MLVLGLALSLWLASGVAIFLLMVLLCTIRKGAESDEQTRAESRGRRVWLRRRLPAQRSGLES